MKRKVPELCYRSSRICRALGNPTAYMILKVLSKAEKKPTEMASILKLSVPTISIALRNLRNLDLVRYENTKEGKFYFVKDKTIIAAMKQLEHLVVRIETHEY